MHAGQLPVRAPSSTSTRGVCQEARTDADGNDWDWIVELYRSVACIGPGAAGASGAWRHRAAGHSPCGQPILLLEEMTSIKVRCALDL
eukprot:scaffold113269_cov21-Tisochrysis_lutea.AAC.2